jgi:ligand-binding SRPBCC domain-containing protein
MTDKQDRMSAGEHILRVEQIVPCPRTEVFAFFAEARNLERITPASLRFVIESPLPITMARGTIIDYHLRLFIFPFKWKTRITAWEPNVRFVDEQVDGPYREWVHTHSFSDVDGGTLVRDVVKYRLPLFPLGEVAYPLVRRQLEKIFDYRRERIREMLGGTL